MQLRNSYMYYINAIKPDMCKKIIAHGLSKMVVDEGKGVSRNASTADGKEKGGTGLGLAITSRLLEKLGSKLNIESELDKGSTFSFDIPLAIGELSLVEQRHQSKDYVTGLDVLLVEDLDLNQKIAIEFMADDEHKIKLAKDGTSAIELMQKHHFDVVLLDMNLPDLTGQEVLKKLKNSLRGLILPVLSLRLGYPPT